MPLSVGFANAVIVTIGGKSTATLDAESAAGAESTDEALEQTQESGKVRTGTVPEAGGKAQKSASTQSIAVQVLLKRMQELQQQLREQQQQLAAAQARAYPTEDARTSAVLTLQGQIADTSGALQQVTGNLITELARDSGSGALVNTTV